jgi:hypothetical protein
LAELGRASLQSFRINPPTMRASNVMSDIG